MFRPPDKPDFIEGFASVTVPHDDNEGLQDVTAVDDWEGFAH